MLEYLVTMKKDGEIVRQLDISEKFILDVLKTMFEESSDLLLPANIQAMRLLDIVDKKGAVKIKRSNREIVIKRAQHA